MSLFKGSGVAIVTPFNEDLTVNYDKLGEILDFHLDNETDAIIICGTTGEASTLSDEEQISVVKYTVEKVNKKIPVIAGAGSNDTKHGIELSKSIEEVGVDGLLLVTPYYNKTSQKGLIEHFTAMADAVNIPIILYNVPGRTGLNMLPETILKLSEHKNIIGVKEASGDLGQVAKIASLCGPDFAIYSGNDDVIVPTLSLGGVGVISVLANICPKETHQMVQSYLDGDVKKAEKIQLEYKKLIDSLFIEPNPIPVKEAMNLMGFEIGKPRLPLTTMEENTKKVLSDSLRESGLI
ncbi:MAG: 4-hydroxy-tetrahydrodipicolinate synthase [Andreesenia angusta]|nr:4-hydroxy-tetrahydrodipicolinate synthase [Andreesenia angusta]